MFKVVLRTQTFGFPAQLCGSVPVLHRINGSIPSSVEIQDNLLLFKGPLTYDLQGTYACDATNSIGTRSATVEISVIGKTFHLMSSCCEQWSISWVLLHVSSFLEKPLPQIATGDVISVIALLLAAGVLMGITITVLVLKIKSRKDDSLCVNIL